MFLYLVWARYFNSTWLVMTPRECTGETSGSRHSTGTRLVLMQCVNIEDNFIVTTEVIQADR